MRGRVVWIERNRFFEVLLCFGPLQVITIGDEGERCVSLSQTLVDRERFARRVFRLLIRIISLSHVVDVK